MKPAASTPTALLLVDIQKGFKVTTAWGDGVRSTPQFEDNAAALLNAARAFNDKQRQAPSSPSSSSPILIIHIHHHSLDPKSALHPSAMMPNDSTVHSVEPLEFAAPDTRHEDGEEPVIVKHHNSAFVGTDLEARLRAAGIRQLVVAGLTTDHCVSTTTRMAANLQVLGALGGPDGSGPDNHGVVVVRDATATFGRGGFDADTVHNVNLATLHGEFAQVRLTEEVVAEVMGA